MMFVTRPEPPEPRCLLPVKVAEMILAVPSPSASRCRPRRWTVSIVIAALAFLAVACEEPAEETPTVVTGLVGSLNLEGSSTVAPYTRLAIEAFEAQHPGVIVTTGELGSGGGITSFINREVPIAASSRPIQSDEIAQAEARGLSPTATTIAWDALAIIVAPSNPVSQLTLEEVARIFSGAIRDWSEVGGEPGEITLYTRNEESGTFAYVEDDVIRLILGPDAEYDPDVNKQASALSGLTLTANDPSGISYVGLSNLSDVEPGSVRVVPIARDASSAAVVPSEATVRSGEYPIARGLFYYTDGDPAQSPDPLVRAWIEFVVSPEGQAIAEQLHLVPAH